ncbi:MAG: hypothetical protein WDO24_25910 [Pseudomonadota bacterium]
MSARPRPISATSARRTSSRPAARRTTRAASTRRASRASTNGAWRAIGRSGGEHAALNAKDGGIVYRFHARDLHLVLGPAPDGRPVHFRVTIDGAAPATTMAPMSMPTGEAS